MKVKKQANGNDVSGIYVYRRHSSAVFKKILIYVGIVLSVVAVSAIWGGILRNRAEKSYGNDEMFNNKTAFAAITADHFDLNTADIERDAALLAENDIHDISVLLYDSGRIYYDSELAGVTGFKIDKRGSVKLKDTVSVFSKHSIAVHGVFVLSSVDDGNLSQMLYRDFEKTLIAECYACGVADFTVLGFEQSRKGANEAGIFASELKNIVPSANVGIAVNTEDTDKDIPESFNRYSDFSVLDLTSYTSPDTLRRALQSNKAYIKKTSCRLLISSSVNGGTDICCDSGYDNVQSVYRAD